MTRVCEVCGKEFEQKPGVRPMRFCSLTCSRRFETEQRANDPEYKARKAARDRAYAATPEGRERLRAAVRKYQAKKRAERLAALQERLATSPIHCQRCGAPLDPQRPGRKVYCAECGREVNREKTRENMALRYEAKKAAREAARTEPVWKSETRTCEVCGSAFVPAMPNQLTCSRKCYHEKCRDKKRTARAESAKVGVRKCAWCGKVFQPSNGRQVYCSIACYMGARQKRERDRCEPKASGGGLTLAQIERVKADVQLPPSERYAASKEWTPAMHTYARKLYEQHHGLFSACRPEGGFNGSQN